MTPNQSITLACFIALIFLGCSTPSKNNRANTTIEKYRYLTFKKENLFPGDSSLSHPEDGVALSDGRVIVSDQKKGLRLIEQNGSTRPFGNFSAAIFENNPPEIIAVPNGMFLEHDKQHLLLCDIRSGKIYRINIASENVSLVYDHPFGVNAIYRDRMGAIWFTQSGKSTEKEGLGIEVNSPVPSAAIYRMADLNSVPVIIDDSLHLANGITMDPDEKTLYVAETMLNRVISYQIDVFKGSAKYSGTVATIIAPDNIFVDAANILFIASPGSNQVIAVDLKNHSQWVLFDASTEESRKLADEWYWRSQLGLPRGELITHEMHSPLPGLLTGMFFSQDGRTLYVTTLGNDIVKININ